ncbi:MAG: hypothetical protein JW888_05230 [Pirellulales bacterium]|nr:hypothetical protein [Pirellulales bacterium]
MTIAPMDRVRLVPRMFLLVVSTALLLAFTDLAPAQLTDPTRENLFDSSPRGTGLRPTQGFGRRPLQKPAEKPVKKEAIDPLLNDPLMPGDIPVVEVRIVGNQTFKKERILPHIHTRVGRPYRNTTIQRDVRRLYKTGMFVTIEPSYQDLPQGRVVIFKVIERPTLKYVKYVGNQKIKDKTLVKETGLAAGDAADPFSVEEARRAIEDFYHEKGFSLARVSVSEGNKPGDCGAVFVIHEGPKQKILWTDFVGNTIASDAVLTTHVQSKQGIFWLFKGEFDRKVVEADKDALVAYYRGLGFFRAKVGAEVTGDPDGQWVRITFVIDEGPRWSVHDVSFVGNSKLPTSTLREALKLKTGDFFAQNAMNADILRLREQYGAKGYIFADVKAEPRFLEEPGQLDLVYRIDEGDRYRMGRVFPKILGDSPHTKITVLLNAMSQQPGDIIDTRELRASERRIQFSQVFDVNPQTGKQPKIVFSPADAKEIEEEPPAQIARPPRTPNGFRGQSPDHFDDSFRDPLPSVDLRLQPLDWWLSPKTHLQWPYPQDGGTR